MIRKRLILSFDGGGILGYLSCKLLTELWDVLPENRIYAGTSTGGIIALALAHGLPPSAIAAMYKNNAKKIFTKSWFAGYGAKYTNEGLREVLTGVFGQTKLWELESDVIITASELGNKKAGTYDRATIFHNIRGQSKQIIVSNMSCIDAALATSAAPTYFPVHYINGRSFVDGGLFANDPANAALRIVGTQDTDVLSIGTGLVRQVSDPGWWMGKIGWLRPITSFMTNGSQDVVMDYCRQDLGDNYFRLNPETSSLAMDDIECFDAIDELIESNSVKEQIADAREWLATSL